MLSPFFMPEKTPSITFVEQRSDSGAPITILASRKRRHVVAWIPYLTDLERMGKKGSKQWRASFQGGEVTLDLAKLRTLMFYGSPESHLPLGFLHDASLTGTTLIIHSSRNRRPLFFTPSVGPDRDDLLSAQIRFRDNQRKRMVIARALVSARITQQARLSTVSEKTLEEIRKAPTIEALRQIEARQANRYWRAFYKHLDREDWTRRGDNPVALALDAISAFQAGLLMRWVGLHRLSPSHGFLHTSTDYPALLYDLIEPCRHVGEMAVIRAWEAGATDDHLIAASVEAFKGLLGEWTEVPSLQVSATHKAIMHGHVLALRAYLSGEMLRLNLPLDEAQRSKGRPVKVSYQIPGAVARHR
jgi:hypothetical protein